MDPDAKARFAVPEWVNTVALRAVASVVCARECCAPAASDLWGSWYVAYGAPVWGAPGAIVLVGWSALVAEAPASAPCVAFG